MISQDNTAIFPSISECEAKMYLRQWKGTQLVQTHSATLVPEQIREIVLPTLFGQQHMIIAENMLYNLMGLLSPRDYGGASGISTIMRASLYISCRRPEDYEASGIVMFGDHHGQLLNLFSCLHDVDSPPNAAGALDLYIALCEENAVEDPPSDGFLLSFQAPSPEGNTSHAGIVGLPLW